jgi:hypothetical protein
VVAPGTVELVAVITYDCICGPMIGAYIDNLGIYYFIVGLDCIIADTSYRGGPAKIK